MKSDPERQDRLEWASLSDRGCVRPGNEDFTGDPDTLAALAGPRANLATRGAFFAVADGMGGHARGEVASKLAVEVLFSTFYTVPGETAEKFRRAMMTANTAVAGRESSRRRKRGGRIPMPPRFRRWERRSWQRSSSDDGSSSAT